MSESNSKEPVPTIETTQVPLKKRKLSENITATTETEETTKRPAKNLIELNLPTPNKSNVGKFQQDIQDHVIRQLEKETQEESLSALNRYPFKKTKKKDMLEKLKEVLINDISQIFVCTNVMDKNHKKIITCPEIFLK